MRFNRAWTLNRQPIEHRLYSGALVFRRRFDHEEWLKFREMGRIPSIPLLHRGVCEGVKVVMKRGELDAGHG